MIIIYDDSKDLIEMTMKKMDEDKDGKVSFADFEVFTLSIVITIAFIVIHNILVVIIVINNNKKEQKLKHVEERKNAIPDICSTVAL